MSNIHYSRLAGVNYKGISKINRTSLADLVNGVGTFAIPVAHPDYPLSTTADGPPPIYIVTDHKITTESDGTVVSTSKVRNAYREVYHSFRYYEALGSVYGSHNIIMDLKTFNSEPNIERWHTEPVDVERIDNLGITNPSKLDSTLGQCVLTLNVKRNEDGTVSTQYETYSEDDEVEVFIGEFHLLPNTPRNIYRCNLSWDFLPITEEENKFAAVDGMSVSSLFSNNGITNRYTGTVIKKPLTQAYSNFIQYELGVSRVPSSNRPDVLDKDGINIRHPNYMEAGAEIRWKSLREACSSWIQIYDGSNLKDLMSLSATRTGHYALNTRAIINIEKLSAFLKTLPEHEYKIVLHLPWYSILAHDAISTVAYPRLSSFIDNFDMIEFKAPMVFKTGGSYHFTINIYSRDKETIIYSESTDGSDRIVGGDIPEDIRAGRWVYQDGEDYVSFPTGSIRFDSTYSTNHGINSNKRPIIRYYPSDDIMSYVSNNEGLSVQIITKDGTLVNNVNPTFTLK